MILAVNAAKLYDSKVYGFNSGANAANESGRINGATESSVTMEAHKPCMAVAYGRLSESVQGAASGHKICSDSGVIPSFPSDGMILWDGSRTFVLYFSATAPNPQDSRVVEYSFPRFGSRAGGLPGVPGKASMELQSPSYFPGPRTASSGDTIEMLSPSTASLAKLAAVVRPPCPVGISAVDTFQTDERADLTPSQSVERKLVMLVKSGAIPTSHFRHKKASRRA